MGKTGESIKGTKTAKRLCLVLAGAFIMAFNLNTFIAAGGLIPGGFTGIVVLLQDIFERFLGISIPFSVLIYAFNAVPAIICFKYIGKRFVLYSCLMIVVCGLLTDFMPHLFIDYIKVQDVLLSAVFGGILNGTAIVLCLLADATSGGTDFIAIYFSEKCRKDIWNIIFIGNCVILIFAAFLNSIDKALYSIIFQFTTTMILKGLYKGYQQKTLLIITSEPDKVYACIRDLTHHDATSFSGIGFYQKKERILLYSVVSAAEANSLLIAIKKIDAAAFINVIKTDQINGLFYRRAKD
ncbi:YitT family protein [Breznakiellaceae bacterium SP9]